MRESQNRFRKYFDALSAKDFATVAGMFADDIVWHQPGDNRFPGTRRGAAAVDQDGIDLLRVEGDRIAEVWLFSSDPAQEDAFWGAV
ncbi:nuclear transport factor 2 family protein [Crossiella sp. NPDC003009]